MHVRLHSPYDQLTMVSIYDGLAVSIRLAD